ncbi:MAG: transposase [Gammaproteobacteria bacterium]
MAKKRGGQPKITEQARPILVEIVKSDPTATLKEVQQELARRTGISAHEQTIQKALVAAGIERKPARESVQVEVAKPTAPRYGYTEAHRRVEPEQTYPSCLTDAEWALVEDLFDNTGHRGIPPRYERRTLVDACCYVVRTGCSWRMLPEGFPAWQNVYRTFRRWSEQGKFEQMHDRLASVAESWIWLTEARVLLRRLSAQIM